MQVLQLDRQAARSVTDHGSQNVAFSTLVSHIHEAHVGLMHIDAGGVVGRHQAAADQLFLVVRGSGWVAGDDRKHTPIEPGAAAFWRSGEWHESGSETGMTALVIEADLMSLPNSQG